MRLCLLALSVAACGSDGSKDPVADLENPTTCMQCHPTHYQQWSGSMHAYASDDPVFVAMQNRGQREAQLGTFCVKCHAPMAVQLHPDADYTSFDPSQLPEAERGITCYFCHNVKDVVADHATNAFDNNGLELAFDQTMHGGVEDPPANDSPAHDSAFDPLLMQGKSRTNTSTMCGSCHDVVTPRNVAIERTYSEWLPTIFVPTGALPESCATCHMVSGPTLIASGAGLHVSARDTGFHDHTFAAIDQALTPFPATAPENAAQAQAIDDIVEPGIAIVGAKPPTYNGSTPPPGGVCLEPLNGGQIRVRIDSFQLGHMFPSGASQDRRVWVEVIAYDANNNVVFSSGVVGDTQDPETIGDPNLLRFWDDIYKDDGTPAHFFWEVASEDTTHQLRPAVTTDPTSDKYDHSTTQLYPVNAVFAQIDHITARIRTRAFNYAALLDLVASGDLDPMYAAQITTLDPASEKITWTKATMNSTTFCNY